MALKTSLMYSTTSNGRFQGRMFAKLLYPGPLLGGNFQRILPTSWSLLMFCDPRVEPWKNNFLNIYLHTLLDLYEEFWTGQKLSSKASVRASAFPVLLYAMPFLPCSGEIQVLFFTTWWVSLFRERHITIKLVCLASHSSSLYFWVAVIISQTISVLAGLFLVTGQCFWTSFFFLIRSRIH